MEEVRLLPGFAHFLAPTSWDELSEAVDADEALVYVVSAPYGSLAIVVCRPAGELKTEVIEAPSLSSSDLMRSFLSADGRAGYFLAQQEGGELTAALDEFGASLGAQLLAPLAQRLREIGIARLCLVPTGLLSLLPLHALACSKVGAGCLLDDFTVVFAPSALVRAVCRRRRVSGESVRRSLIVGDPQPSVQPLPGAAFEISMIAQLIPAHQIEVLSGTNATRERVLEHLPGADHVHFACHGAASFFDEALGAALYLSNDEPLTARDVLSLR
ncbi:MAG TPA: CHAT domain-containing protein, partial [Anaeromyxobacteraceae bacterium]|nr:CHAT domain-containing protein [Anaeromyxobacteraceae bacterium]